MSPPSLQGQSKEATWSMTMEMRRIHSAQSSLVKQCDVSHADCSTIPLVLHVCAGTTLISFLSANVRVTLRKTRLEISGRSFSSLRMRLAGSEHASMS